MHIDFLFYKKMQLAKSVVSQILEYMWRMWSYIQKDL